MATSATVSQCPECGTEPVSTTTETVCPNCNLVVDDSPIDHGPEWRNFDEGPDKSRAYPGDSNRADRGLGSHMGYSSERSGKERRLQRWNAQAKREKKKDRNRDYSTREIGRIGAALDLPDSLIAQAKHLFRQAHDAGLLLGRDLDTLTAACVYATCRLHQRGVTPKEVADVSRTDTRALSRRHSLISRELGLPTPPPEPEQRIRIVGNELGVTDREIEKALSLCESVDPSKASSGSPSTLAAACLYQVSGKTQRECADAAGVSTAAIRNRLGEMPGVGLLAY